MLVPDDHGSSGGAAYATRKLLELGRLSRFAPAFLARSDELAVGDRKAALGGHRTYELVGSETERHLRELHPTAHPIDPHTGSKGSRHARNRDFTQKLEAREVATGVGKREVCGDIGGGFPDVDAHLGANLVGSNSIGKRAEDQQIRFAKPRELRVAERTIAPGPKHLAEAGRIDGAIHERAHAEPHRRTKRCSRPR